MCLFRKNCVFFRKNAFIWKKCIFISKNAFVFFYCYLGIEMSNTGSFHRATDALYNKSLRALFSLYSALSIHSNEPNTKLYLKLFDSLIKPILLYGADVWGPQISHPNNKISKFVNKFYKTVLGVPRYTSTTGIHIELGRFPIDVNVHNSMLKYWARLITLPSSRLVSHCYWSVFDTLGCSDPWVNSIKNIIFSTGQYEIWNNQKAVGILGLKFINSHISYMAQNLRDQFIQNASSNLNDESKLLYFKNAKQKLSLSSYLLKIKSRDKRSLFAKFRLGVLPLEIEKGRRYKLIRSDRICKFCNTQEVENELHFIFTCPSLETVRSPIFSEIYNIHPFLAMQSKSQQLSYLFFNEHTPSTLLDLSANLLYDLFDRRKVLEIA